MTPERQALAAAQAELVSALVDGGPTPAGFDPARLATASSVLICKRRKQRQPRAVPQTLWMRLRNLLGGRSRPDTH